MEVKIVLGHTFGDEGKGVTVQWLCKKAIEEGKKPLVVRFSGGPQAAHTIFNGGTEHICSSFGSGVLLGVPTFLTGDVFIDPICMKNEYDVLVSKGIKPTLIRGFNRIITPYDVMAGRSDNKVLSDGTCGKGIYPTFKRYQGNIMHHLGVPMIDPDVTLALAANHYGLERNKEYDDMFREAYLWMQTETTIFTASLLKEYDVWVYEGSQGLLLDMDNGFYPHVTPSRVGLNGIIESDLENAEVYLVTRTYTTRHGNGYKPRIPHRYDLSNKHETNITNEFQGDFKTGVLEVDLLNKAYERHCINNYIKKYNMSLNLVVTHMDIIDGCFEVGHGGVCDAYLSGQRINNPAKCIGMIEKHLCYKPDHIYYNDSVESNIKQMK